VTRSDEETDRFDGLSANGLIRSGSDNSEVINGSELLRDWLDGDAATPEDLDALARKAATAAQR